MQKNNKRLLIFILIISSVFYYTQNKDGKIIYNLHTKDKSLKNGGGILYFDQNHSLYIINTEKKEQTTIQKTGDGTITYPSNTIDSIANKNRFIYYNRENKVFYNNIINNNIEVIIKDDTEISWKISKETKRILGYKCYKAMGTLYDNEYEVWFTNKLKLPYGPIKINGLNGLILEVNSNSLGLKITTEKIYLDDENTTSFIKDFNKKYDYSKTKTRKEYDILLNNQIEKLENDINSKIPNGIEKNKI